MNFRSSVQERHISYVKGGAPVAWEGTQRNNHTCNDWDDMEAYNASPPALEA
jgi:hypothetical protein